MNFKKKPYSTLAANETSRSPSLDLPEDDYLQEDNEQQLAGFDSGSGFDAGSSFTEDTYQETPEDRMLRKYYLSKMEPDPSEGEYLKQDFNDFEKKEDSKSGMRLAGAVSEGAAGIGTIYGETPKNTFDSEAAARDTDKQFAEMKGLKKDLRSKGELDPKVAEFLLKSSKMRGEAVQASEKNKTAKEIAQINAKNKVDINFSRIAAAKFKDSQARAAGLSGDKLAKAGEAGARADIINKNIDDLKNDVTSGSINWKKMAMSNYLGYPAGAEYEKFQGTLYDIALDYAKLVDPTSVAREGEVASAKKYAAPILKYLSMPDDSAKSEAILILDQYKQRVRDRMDAMKRNQGLPFNDSGDGGETSQEVSATSGPAPGKPKGDVSIDSKIDSWMSKNQGKFKDREDAIRILKENGYL